MGETPEQRSEPGYVFISYSRKDHDYVDKLTKHLTAAGLGVWTDKGIRPGVKWARTIDKQVRACSVLVPVMSTESRESNWVAREILLAQRLGKPIMPLLLSGEPFTELIDTQHENVSAGLPPPAEFVTNLRELVERRVPSPTPDPVPKRWGLPRRLIVKVSAGALATMVAVALSIAIPYVLNRELPGGPGPDGPTGPVLRIDYAGVRQAPRGRVPQAHEGGQLTVLNSFDVQLDPQRLYSGSEFMVSPLVHRTLTGYLEDRVSDTVWLVGDLATNAGVTTDGGRTWTYTLRDNLRFENGDPIDAEDVAHGIARSFTDFGRDAFGYLQDALDPAGTYHGPYEGAPLPPGVSTPDEKTITFTFATPTPELPYLLALPTSAPVPAELDTRESYETQWVASGPYRRQELVPGESLTLEHNPFWDPTTDPIRHRYPETIRIELNVDPNRQTTRLRSPTGADRSAVMTAVDVQQLAEINADPELARLGMLYVQPGPFMTYVFINTARVTELAVRQALNYAFDRDEHIEQTGGRDQSRPATTLLAPVVPGQREFDVYDYAGHPHGDVERAKALLGGRTVQLTYCVRNTEALQAAAYRDRHAFARAGIEVTVRAMDVSVASFMNTVSSADSDCDLIRFGRWGQDYPDGDSTMRFLLDGTNFSHFHNEDISEQLATLRAAVDRTEVADRYAELDERVMRDYAPVIPERCDLAVRLAGPDVRNTFISWYFGEFDLTAIYVLTAPVSATTTEAG